MHVHILEVQKRYQLLLNLDLRPKNLVLERISIWPKIQGGILAVLKWTWPLKRTVVVRELKQPWTMMMITTL